MPAPSLHSLFACCLLTVTFQILRDCGGEAENALEKLAGLVLSAELWSGLAVLSSDTQESLNTLSLCAHHVGRQLVYLGHSMIPAGDRFEYL